jgi:hypothetical protein
VVYGLRDAADPWTGPVLIVSHIVAGSATRGDWPDGEAVTIDGKTVTVFQGEDGNWIARWPVDDGQVQVAGRELTRDQAIAAAAATAPSPSIGAAELPDGFAELARGPMDALVAGALGYSGSTVGLAVTYGSVADGSTGYVSIIERPGPASAVDLARLAYDGTRSVTVRGQHAVLAPTGDAALLQWAEPGGLLVTIQAADLSDEDLLRVAENLRPAGPGEIDELLAENPFDVEDPAEGAQGYAYDGWQVEGQYEGQGRAPIAAEVHPVDGAERSAFVGFVLESDLGVAANVVARTSDGTEVARATVGSPLQCVDYPDGRSQCTAAGSTSG